VLPSGFSRKPIVGVVHLPGLPGSPAWRSEGSPPVGAIVEKALACARGFLEAGFDGLIVENYGDVPFFKTSVPPETIAALALCTREIVAISRGKPVGVNVLRNDARAALGVALATGASFVRINVHTGVAATDQGIVEGQAAETIRARDALEAKIAIWADVHVKHARPLDSTDVKRAAADARERGLADVLLVSGDGTGSAPDEAHVKRAREGSGDVPLLLASGLSAGNCARLVPLVDGAVAASDALEGGRAGAPVVPARARALVEAFRRS
jgi:membrane complex biogenesis BtpA family protein